VPLFLRHFASMIDGWTSNGWRYGFSALVWAPVLIIASRRRTLPAGLWRAALPPSIVNAAGQVCFTWAFYFIAPALVTFGLRTQLIFVAIGAWIMFPRERAIIRQPGYLAGAILLLIGAAGVLLLPPSTETDGLAKAVVNPEDVSASAHAIGVALAIISGLLFACYGLSVRKYMHGINPVLAFAAICQYTAAAMVGLMLILGKKAGTIVLDLPSSQVVILLASALIGIAIGHVFYYISIARLGVAVTAGVLQLQPFIVAIGSLALFDERLSSLQWVSGSIAVGGALLMLSVQWRMSRTAPAVEAPVAIAEGESGA
jgi:drug/metabolite transporter (DMT)-like permease